MKETKTRIIYPASDVLKQLRNQLENLKLGLQYRAKLANEGVHPAGHKNYNAKLARDANQRISVYEEVIRDLDKILWHIRESILKNK